VTIGAETIGHGLARAHPLFVSGGHGGEAHGGEQAKHIKHIREVVILISSQPIDHF